ncbi:hypothetical protein ACJIZ3_014420 [Penstemon smallii]|uniref:Uncharacterized protein n=1 Tax=Penstemon smallii TaxID=265156 RepID=A0ABD3RJI1_9LAMI
MLNYGVSFAYIKNSPSPYLIVHEDIWHNKILEFEDGNSVILVFSSKNDIKTIGEDNMRCRYKMFWLTVFVTTSDEVQFVYNHDVDSHYAPRLIPFFIRSSYIVFFTASEIKVPILLFVIGLTDSSDGLLMKNLNYSDFSSIKKDRIILLSTLV